jgi:DNA-directed RNA polymerase subunit RPC12/RpoP
VRTRHHPGDRIDHLLGVSCPKCGAKSGHRTHRRSLFDYFLSLAGVWPYRCERCRSAYRALRPLRKLGEDRPWSMPPAIWRVPEQE